MVKAGIHLDLVGALAKGILQQHGARLDLPAAIEDLRGILAHAPADLRRASCWLGLDDARGDLSSEILLIHRVGIALEDGASRSGGMQCAWPR